MVSFSSSVPGDCAAVAQDYGLGQPLELPHGEPLWPIRKDQQPEVVHSVSEFIEALHFQAHLDRVVVLPGGVHLLGQQHGVPEMLRHACVASAVAMGCSSRPPLSRTPPQSSCTGGAKAMRYFLAALGKKQQDRFKARLWHYGIRGTEKEVKKGGKKKSLREVADALKHEEAEGSVPHDAPLYISELRWLQKVRHPIAHDEMVKCSTSIDIFDVTLLSRRMPLWERSEGGIFVGERGTGSGMHVDQCLWSNVGRNWCGFKLFAVWGWEERHRIPGEVGKGRIFHLPLTREEEGWLSRARVLALVRPGDVWVFSGGQPHTALVVGDGVNISAYESLVPANREAVELLVRSNTRKAHWEDCWMDDEDLDELYEDVVDNLQRSLREPGLDGRLKTRLQECVKAMREKGDLYCKELWEQEDRGERRRQREEEFSESGAEDPKRKKAKILGSEPASC